MKLGTRTEKNVEYEGGIYRHLIGIPGGVGDSDTPALILDIDLFKIKAVCNTAHVRISFSDRIRRRRASAVV